MTALEDELDNNFEGFFKAWSAEAISNWSKLHGDEKLKQSYRRLAAFQALKSVVIPKTSHQIASIFHEAHNDALTSHVQASFGAWRSSLKSLRSFLESGLNCLYFMDHPIEFELWMAGKYKTTFQGLLEYFEKHPRISTLPANITGLNVIRSEYAVLSKAVHGSSSGFWMTDPVSSVLLWSQNKAKLGQWSTREANCIGSLSSLIVCLFHSDLSGAKLPGVRSVLSFAISAGTKKSLKTSLSINIS